jgi:hypothetical protein
MRAVITVSFIIPAHNESAFIADVIANIRSFAPADARSEILVIDNCSNDQTFEIARSHPEVRTLRADGTVGSARNAGASQALGDVLIFLDADVRLTASWQSNIGSVLQQLQGSPKLITGSTVAIPPSASMIERHWFNTTARAPRQYINSGHLIMTRAFFEELHGFDPGLITGEDFDICQRGRARGGVVSDHSALVAIHLGFPKTLVAFARRELWHGQGDGGSLKKALHSKIAVVSVAVACLTIGGPALSLLTGSPLPLVVCLGTCLLITLIFSVRRTRSLNPTFWLINAWLYYVYFLCRSVALIVPFTGWRQFRAADVTATKDR